MSVLRILGNELNGYVLQKKVDGEWRDITRRFKTYDEASKAYANVEN